MLFIWLVFSPIAVLISFFAYREFKGMAFDQMGMQGGSVYGGMGRAFNRGGNGRNRESNDDYD